VTTKDKTGDQLMASIRRTKTEGATPGKETVGAPMATPAAAPKAATPEAKPATAKPARVAKKKVAAKPKPSQTGRGQAPTGYQSHGRVWPD
jgi:hypothetical protein